MNDLTSVIKETLENGGVLNDLRGRVRAEIFRALEDPSLERPKLPSENLLINELIREYLAFNNYQNTLSVLMQESKQPHQPLDRDFICSELHVQPRNSPDLPLLYGIVSHFTEQHSSNRNEIGDSTEEEEEEQDIKQPEVTIFHKWDKSDVTSGYFSPLLSELASDCRIYLVSDCQI